MNVSEILLHHIKKSIELVFSTAVEKIEFQQDLIKFSDFSCLTA